MSLLSALQTEAPVSRPATPGSPAVRWLFLDLNSYFASVEQQERPELRGRPVAVVPVMADTTSCIAASYEAKAFGVKTGVRVGDAKQMCPGLILVEARHRAYVHYHHRIIAAVERCIPVSSVLSIDEMACSLLGRERGLLQALELARAVKQSIRTHVGETLRCSVGLAPNRYLSKIASDMEKPDGLVALTPDILGAALAGLQLRDLPGIGARMERRLHDAGIHSMPQLLALGREGMRLLWNGAAGEKLWWWLQGEDFLDPHLEHQKSISQSHVLPPDLRSEAGAYAVLHKLLHKAAMRLRTARLWTTRLTLRVRYAAPRPGDGQARGPSGSRRHRFGAPPAAWSEGTAVAECQDTQTLVAALAGLWARRPLGSAHAAPFYVGLWLGPLVPDHHHTQSLFSELDLEGKRTRLSGVMDAINEKYGTHTLAAASMLPAGTSAPTRIAFTSIPDLF